MAFFHGVEALEEDKTLGTGVNPDMSVIGLLGTAGKGAVDTATLISANRSEADSTFGAYNVDDPDGFSIPDAVDAIFSQTPSTMIVVNVADPSTHTTAVSAESTTLGANNKAQLDYPYVSSVSISTTISVLKTFTDEAGGTITMPTGIASIASVKSSDGVTTYTGGGTDYTVASNVITNDDNLIAQGATVLVTYTVASLAVDTDYTVDSDSGQITRVTTSTKIDFKATLSVDYNYVDPTKVTASYLATKASEFLDAESLTGKKPKILIAPGFTGTKPAPDTIDPVVAALISQAATLKAVVYSDIIESTTAAAIIFRNDFDDDRLNVYYGRPQVTNSSGTKVSRYASAYAAGHRVLLDKTNPFGAARANSNSVLSNVVSIDRVIDYNNDISSTANTLNGSQVNTMINDGGIKLFGDFTSSTTSSRQFGTTRRILDSITERSIAIVRDFLGQPITNELIDRIIDSIQATLDADRQKGLILGGTAVRSDLNTAITLADGEIYVEYDITPTKPATRITVTQVLTDKYTSTLLEDL